MSAILSTSSLLANSNINKSTSNNNSNGDGASFDSTLQSQTKALNQNNGEQNAHAPKTVKSNELLSTIWSKQGNQNLSSQVTPISSRIKYSSSSVSAETSDPAITIDTSAELPTIPSQDLLAMIWAMQTNTSAPASVAMPDASSATNSPIVSITNDTDNSLTASIANDTANSLTASIANDTANSLTASIANDTAKSLTASIANDTAKSLNASITNDAAILPLKNSEISNDNSASLTMGDSPKIASNPESNLTSSQAPSINSPTPMSATVPSYSIAPSVSQSGWDAALSQRVVWMASQNIQSATLNINPEHLGPLQIQIQLDNNQQANVQFFSAQPEVRLALQNSIPMLSQMLEQTGIQLGQSDVSSQSSGSNPQQQKSNFNTLVNEQIKLDSTSTTVTSTTPINNGNGLLNIYA